MTTQTRRPGAPGRRTRYAARGPTTPKAPGASYGLPDAARRRASELRQRARIGAFALHSQGKTNTAAATRAFLKRFEDQVDPDRKLSEAERQRRAGAARRAYMAGLALKSARARRPR